MTDRVDYNRRYYLAHRDEQLAAKKKELYESRVQEALEGARQKEVRAQRGVGRPVEN